MSAQAIALISPSMTAALIVPLMFGTAGTAGWLCYLFGTIMLLFVAINLNQFAKRYTSAGSMYEYTVKGLGLEIWRAFRMEPDLRVHVHRYRGGDGFHSFCVFAAHASRGHRIFIAPVYHAIRNMRGDFMVLAYKDITFSTVLMLILEGVSVTLILILAVIALGKTGVVDSTSFIRPADTGCETSALVSLWRSSALSALSVRRHLVKNPKKPLITIPRAVIASLLLTALSLCSSPMSKRTHWPITIRRSIN